MLELAPSTHLKIAQRRPLSNNFSVPRIAVEGAVLDGFAEVGGGDAGLAGEVGDGARDLQDAVVGAGGEAELVDGCVEELLRRVVEAAVLLHVLRSHVSVEEEGLVGEPFELIMPRLFNALAHLQRRFAGGGAAQHVVAEGRHLDVDVDAVEQRP